jgi:hypothetical protein
MSIDSFDRVMKMDLIEALSKPGKVDKTNKRCDLRDNYSINYKDI